MPRPAVVVALPREETAPVVNELKGAGFEAVAIGHPDQLAALVRERRDVAVAILDGESDLDTSLEYYSLLHEDGRAIPSLMIVSPSALDRMSGQGAAADDEFFTRPYSAESIRWRVEAMCIRAATIDDGTGNEVLSGDIDGINDWAAKATVLVVFNPKGGVGKTTVATNLAAAIQARGDQRVLLVDADTVTGHILSSLGLDAVPTLADAWRDEAEGGEAALPLAQLAAEHHSGMRVLALTTSPLATELLEPERVATGIEGARRSFDVVVVDLHPSYSALNRAIFEIADRILVPVTPDVPALKAAIQLRDVATDLGIRERLALVINRANSGVSVEDMERAIGMTALSQIRSGGLLFVKAANEGRTVIERFPKEKVSDDFHALSDRLMLPASSAAVAEAATAKAGFRLFGRAKEAARA
jgi:MinD-like ATPase involved in chromosome partitioning or flagellar assembly